MKFIKSLFFHKRLFTAFLVFLILFGGIFNRAVANDFLIAVDDFSRIYFAQSNNDGTFSGYVQIGFLGGNYSRGVTINDFNNDGHMDFIAGRAKSGTGYYYLFLNDGSNYFSKHAMVGTQSNTHSFTMDMASGDFNNDGNMDFVSNGNQSTTGIWLGDGQGIFSRTEVDWGAYGRGMDTADFNHDGNLDIVRARYSNGDVYVYWGDGTGNFPTNTYVGDVGSDPYGVMAGDFDNDGHPDVFANSGSNGDTYFFAGNGDGTFLAPVYESTLDLNNHGSFDAYDYDSDGNLDVLIANYTGRNIYYYPGNGDATFGLPVSVGTTLYNSFGISAPPNKPPVNRPIAVITPIIASITTGSSVDFDGSISSDSDGTIIDWDWTFGDGGSITGENPAPYIYTDEGVYTPTLKVTDDGGKADFATARVVVQGDLLTIFTSAVAFGEAYADHGIWDISLDGTDYSSDTEGVVSYAWDLGDGLLEDFEDGDTIGWKSYAGTWLIEDISPLDGSYSYRQTDTGANRTWVLFDQNFNSDLIIEADVHLEAGPGEEAHIIFRAQDKYNNYEFILRGRGYNDILLYKQVNGSSTNVFEYDLPTTADFSGPGYPIDQGHSYHIKIVCTGSLIQFHLDDNFLFAYSDSTYLKGQVGFSTYRTEALFDNLTVTTMASGQIANHHFSPGTYNVMLTAADASGQTASGSIPMTMAAGDPPVADAGGPYFADESVSFEGGWTVSLDGSGSSDDLEIQQYLWDFGTDSFTGTEVNEGKWVYTGNVSQNGEISIAHPDSGWGKQYFFSKDIYTRAPGMAFETSVKQTGQNAMIGFKNTNTNYHYNQMPYAIYFADGNLHIYEDGASRGDTGYNYSYNIWYDIRIELKETQGARYYYRLSGDLEWILLKDSDYGIATEFKRGADVYQSTFVIDNLREIAAGPMPDYRLYGLGDHPFTLTVYDRAEQSNTDSSIVTNMAANPPIADAGSDQSLSETDASNGFWTVDFDASGSSDDHGIYTYEWDWDYDGSSFNPTGDTGATPSHTWNSPGTYTVAVQVTDHAMQTQLDEAIVVFTMGSPPLADAGGPYAVDEFSGNVFENAWAVTLDSSGSTDDTSIERYYWELGIETFDGTHFMGGKWYTNGGISQDDTVSVTGANSWGNRYIVSQGTVPNQKGQVFQTRVKDTGTGDAMLGFKNTSSTLFQYDQFPYQFYLYNRNVYIYEHSSSRGDTGFNIDIDTWYDFKIELTSTGAVYSYKLATDIAWTIVYTSSYQPGETELRKGMVVHNGTFALDDFVETAGGSTPTVYLSGLGSHTLHLTAYDQAEQSDTDSTSVIISANAAPVADAGVDQSKNEGDVSQGEWIVDFSGTASDDGPNGEYFIEWDFDFDGSTFTPSTETGPTVSHVYDTVGSYTVAMRAFDHALQSVIDTQTVTISAGNIPVANAGTDLTTEGELWVRFDGTRSIDDFRIRQFEWDFGDNIKGTGQTPAHIYHTPGVYTATLTVTDEANQTDTDTVTVTVLAAGQAAAPTANAGGPYNAGAGGPPAYFNGSSSSDDYGIVKYFWDVDSSVDSDADGNFTNDVDTVGRKPFYTYASAGSYTVTLTVEDGVGQQHTATSIVNVADNLAPDVICVPWRGSDPTIPHDVISGENARLKCIVRDAGNLEYRWNYGDGTGWTGWATVSNKYAIESDHIYTGAMGTPYTAVLEVRDSAGLVGQDNFYLMIRPDNYDTRTNITIDDGLWYIHKQQIRPAGYWQYGSYYIASTSSSLQAFMINSHVQGGDHQEDPYVETVTEGFEDLFTRIRSRSIGIQSAGNPDTNGNGIGIEANSGRPIYEGGPVMDAIASSNTPGAFAYTGPTNVKGRYYLDILRDMSDAFAWGQVDTGTARGGWRYSWNSGADNSASQWAAIGVIPTEDNFGIWIPDFVKTENNSFWLEYSYNGTGFGYSSSGNTAAGTPSGMVQLAFDGVYTSDSRWRSAEDYIATNWSTWSSNFYYATYSMAKAFRLAQPNPVVTFGATGFDWYNDPVSGLRKYLVDRQENTGSWYAAGHGGGSDRDLSTPWVVIMLTPALFTQPPEADAGDDIIWAFDEPLAFNASGSRHLDPQRNIVQYEWDFDGDGSWDFTTTDPSDPNAKYTYPDPNPGTGGDPLQVFTTRLRVTDDNDPAQKDIDTREVTVAEPPHAPYANAGGPYTITAGIPFALNGGGSSDINPGDSISNYQWDLDNDGVFFDDFDWETPDAITLWMYPSLGVYNIGLIVEDNGAFNPVGCTMGVDCISMSSLPDFTTVTVVENLAPAANAGGPYVVNEGVPLTLDGSASSDPNGDALTFAWDLDNDGAYDDSSAVAPSWTWNDDGTYTVSLKVTDSLLEDSTTVDVIVNDLAPSAGFIWAPEPSNEGTVVTFTSTSISMPDTISAWSWDFSGLGTSTDQNPDFTFNDNGNYSVTLMVTDNDGSTDTEIHTVSVNNVAPDVNAGPDQSVNEGDTVNFNGSFSDPGIQDTHTIEWDFGDGSPPESGNLTPAHNYSEDGVYTVTLTVTDNDGSSGIATLTIEVLNSNLPPTANSGGPYSAISGEDIILDGSNSSDANEAGGSNPVVNPATSSGYDEIIRYQWDLDGDSLYGTDDSPTEPEGVNPTVNFGSFVGTKTIGLKVTDSFGATGTHSTELTSMVVPDIFPSGYELVSRRYNRRSRLWTVSWKVYISNTGDAEVSDVSAVVTDANIPAGVTVHDDSVSWTDPDNIIDPSEVQLSGNTDSTFSYSYPRTSPGPEISLMTWDIEFTDSLGTHHVTRNIPQ